MGSNGIQSTKFIGHQGAVLTMDYSSSLSCLLSGSEDCTARLWDLRSSKSTNCIIAGEEVTAVAFGPSFLPPSPETTGFSQNYIIYLGMGTKVIGFDLRKVSSPIVRLGDDSIVAETFLEADDEINQIVLVEQQHKRGSTSLHLAAADDTGMVQVLDITGQTPSKGKSPLKRNLLHCAERANMVTSAVFRPRSKNLELASGGTDCQVCLWDANKPKKPLFAKKITADTSAGSRTQLCNPPMVHSLAWSPSGRLLAAGLGDGTASVYSIENRSCVEVARLQEANDHDSSVASVIFPALLPAASSQHAASQDRLLACIRNDAVIKMWDLGCTVAGEKAIDPSISLSDFANQENEELTSTSMELEDAIEDLSLVDTPRMLFKIQHHSKPNWMISTGHADPNFPSSVFVSDVTNDITAYTIPIR